MGQKEVRKSNVELLRILVMCFIVLGHTNLFLAHLPLSIDIERYPLISFGKVAYCCLGVNSVDTFIAISGWFGIHFRKEGLFKYLFQVLFILWTIYGLAIVLNVAAFDVHGIQIGLGFYNGYWFVTGYLGLYLISPMLNTFIEHTSKREYQIVLLSYFLFQGYFSWLSAWYDYYGGYSVILFGGVYLTAAYLHKYPIVWVQNNAFSLFVFTILLMTVITSLSLWKCGHAARMIRDDNPLVIIASILLLLSFNKLHFHCKIVNWLAASCFAVYLIHFNPFVLPYIMELMHRLYVQFDGLLYGLMLIIALSLIYLACTLFDQLRILTWTLVQKTVDDKK